MFPFLLDELTGDKRENLNRIFKFGPFPEPLLFGEEDFAMRWNRDYIHRLVEEDVASRLKNLIGSPISINALREDLQVAHKTVAHWLEILEALYFHFRIYPFGAPLIRAVKKEAKLYLFDWLPVQNQGYRFENMIAFHLFKAICEKVDSTGEEWELRYFRDVDGREVDFLITHNGTAKFAVEAKVQDEKKHISSLYIKKKFPDCAVYLVFLRARC
jgi:predicted AAA+ superfamily ATPase